MPFDVPVRFFIVPFRLIGSLTFGIALLSFLLLLLAFGTFIEAEYGTAVSQFALYANPWFHLITALLGLNIFVSVLLRWPWQRNHIPFLIVHFGIVILLFGCFLTWQYGEEAQITLPEGTVGMVAVKPASPQFMLQYINHSDADASEMVHIPFLSGPFSWRDYQYDHWKQKSNRYKLPLWYAMQTTLPFLAASHSVSLGRGEDASANVEIEVLDYLAHSAVEPVPPLDLRIRWNDQWESVRLDLQPQQVMSGLTDSRGVNVTMPHGQRITYNLALSQKELTAFRQPQTSLYLLPSSGLWGEVVLFHNGKHYSIDVEDLKSLEDGQYYTVPDSALTISNVRFRDRGPIIHFVAMTQTGDREAITLFPDNPELNVQARRLGIFGTYWVDPTRIMHESADHTDNPMLQRLAAPRLDFLQGMDGNLYYRVWSGRQVVADGSIRIPHTAQSERWEADDMSMNSVSIDTETLSADFNIVRFVPQDVPGGRVVPAAATPQQHGEQRVELRVLFDGAEDVFWIRAATPTVVPLPPEQDQIQYLYGNNRTLAVQLNFETLDLGFGILLKQFDKRTEPGLRMSSHYSSLVDYVEPTDSAAAGLARRSPMFSPNLEYYRTLPGGADILISMNRPGFFRGQSVTERNEIGQGRGYRIYQASYIGPFYPDQPQFHEIYDGRIFPWESRPRESIALSTLSVNDDPGRGWKYLGSFLIVLGSALFVWRRSVRVPHEK